MATKRRIAAVDQAVRPDVLKTILAASGTTPLEVLTNTMQMLYNGSQRALEQFETAVGPEREYLLDVARKHALDACALAKEIAPYMHRKQPLAVETRDMTDEDKQRQAVTVQEVGRILAESQRLKRQTEAERAVLSSKH